MTPFKKMGKSFRAIIKRANAALETDDPQFLAGALCHIRETARAALDIKPRNCDVIDNCYDAADAWPESERCLGRRAQ